MDCKEEDNVFQLADFLIYCFITAYTPGANNLLSMNYAAKYGFRNSFVFNLGITAGFLVIMVLCTAFTSAINALIPKARIILQILGAAYMLYLAWKIYRSSSSHDLDSSHRPTFVSGMLLQFVNFKIYIYAITAMSLYIMPVYDSIWMLVIFVLILTLIGASGSFVWAFFGTLLCDFVSKHEKTVNTIMALLLVYCAVALFI